MEKVGASGFYRTTRRPVWSEMAETACDSSNAFCGPIQGEVKAKAAIVQFRTMQAACRMPLIVREGKR
jgi:hypothetical protein